MNIQTVWDQGITGKGVVVTILDDGKVYLELVLFFIILRSLFESFCLKIRMTIIKIYIISLFIYL